MRSPAVVTLCAVIACAACGDSSSAGSKTGAPLALEEGTWVLTVDRARPSATLLRSLPEGPVPDSIFVAVTGGPSYRLEVSRGGASIVVREPRLVGRLDEARPERLSYALVEGAFAGGRIVVWRTETDLRGELTIYGSGLPVVRSERGVLRKE